ncbi:MAG TPA: PAS domain-containing protein [Pseudolabrys sp.]|nr:PAS domain-containing protein [Pseudolabrys sp.]
MRNRLVGLKPSLLSYAVVALGVTAAVIANLLLETYLQAFPTLFLFLCTIIFAVWFGGVGPGLAATMLSILAFDYFFLVPIYSFNFMLRDLPRIVLFATASLFVLGLMVAQRNAAESLRRSGADLEDKVRDLEKLNAALQIEGTERQRAEQKSRKVERDLQDAIDTVPALVASFEADGSREFVNRPWRDYTGLSLEEARAATWATIIHPDDVEAGKAEWRDCFATGKAYQLDCRVRRADGEYRWHMTRCVALRDDEGNIVKWYGIAFDIEDKKRAENALRESEVRLAEAERELRLTIDRIPTLAWHTRPDGFAEYLNKRWLDYTGLSLDRALGWEWQIAIHPEDLPRLLDSWREILEAGKPAEVEARMRRFDGEYRWFLFRPEPFRDEFGNVVRWYGTNTDIEDRKRAEDALRQSEAYLADAQRIAHVGYWERDLAANFLTWSEETSRIFGLLPEEGRVSFERLQELIHPEDRQRIVAAGAEALRSGGRYDAEYRVVRPNGEVRIIHSRGNVTMDKSGRARRMFGIVQDLTERKLAEATLRERAQLLDLTHDTIFVRGMNDVISFWNRGAEQLYGWSKEEALGQVSHQLLRPIFPAPLEEITSELLKTSHWEGELVHTKRDATQVTVGSRWSLRQDERGRPVGILETNNDITERKRAEYLTGHVFESSPDGIAIIGRDYRIQRVNAVHERFWEQPAGSMVGKRTAEIMGNEFFEHKGKSNLDRCFAGEEIRYADWFATPHGRKYLAISISPQRPNSHQVEAALLIARDFTDYAQASEALRETQMELAHVNRLATMGQLTASIAHEVSQPLAAAVTNASAGLRWLAAQPPDLEEIRGSFEGIIKAGNQASEVISRIRGLIKKVPAQRAALDVNEAVLETIALTRSEMLQHRILLKTELANDLPRISGDRIQLQQVMLNLIINAIEAMTETSEGPRELLIRSEIDLPNGVMVTVRDGGPGLKPESLNRLFDPFYSTKPAGMGMGLSICRAITEAHGGRLWATANTPRGAVFQFTLHQNDES